MFDRLSIRRKVTLVIVLSSALALLLAAAGLIFFELVSFKGRAESSLKALAGVISSFHVDVPDSDMLKRDDARVSLAILDKFSDIISAHLYRPDGSLLAPHYRPDQKNRDTAPSLALPSGELFSFDRGIARLVTPVKNGDGVTLAVLDIRSDVGTARRELRQRLLIITAVMIVLLGVSIVSARYLQKSITYPLLDLADTARSVADKKDYSLRAPVRSRDETGQLATTFNAMLAAIQQHGQALRQSEARFRSVWERSADGMIITDKEGQVLAANPAFCRLANAKMDSVVSRSFYDIVIIPDHQAGVQRYRDAFQKKNFPTLLEQRLEFSSGRSAEVEMSNSFIEFGDQGEVLLTIFRNITERKQAEEQLRMLSQAVQQSPTAVLITNPQGEIQYVNRKFVELTGYTWEEVLGKNPRFLKSGESPASVYKDLWESLSMGNRWSGEFHNKRKDGSKFWACTIIAPIKDSSGKIVHYLGDIEDITDRKLAEETKAGLEAQLRQAQKMEALGTLAGGIAHDFNNILGAIIGYTELAQMDSQDRPEIIESLNQVILGSHRARDLVRQILAFSRRSKQERKPLRLQPLVAEALKLLRSTLPANIEIVPMIQDDAPVVMADPTQIHQVLMNLSTNASHAMKPGGGRLTVGVGKIFLDDEFAKSRPDLRSGAYARLFVTDTGHGMNEATIRRIFDPFFTTKAPGEGTGLGLSVVHGIVKDHEGTILVESQPRIGTTIQIFLPAHGAVADEVETEKTEVRHGSGQHILVVDDELALCKTSQKVLERLGYRVTTHTHPSDALDVFKSRPHEFSLVVTDLSMPAMTGIELAAELLKARHDIPIVLTSGFVGPQTWELAARIGVREVVPKPVSPSSLGELAYRLLNPKP